MALVGSPVMQALQARSQKLLLQVDTKVGQAASASALQIAVLFCASLCSPLASQLCSLLRLIVQACCMLTLQAVPSCALQPVCCTRWLTQACPQVDSLCSTAGYWLWPSSYRAHQALGQGLQLDSKAFARVGTAHELDASQSTSSPPAGDSSSAASARVQRGPVFSYSSSFCIPVQCAQAPRALHVPSQALQPLCRRAASACTCPACRPLNHPAACSLSLGGVGSPVCGVRHAPLRGRP